MRSLAISELDDFDLLVKTYQPRFVRLVSLFTGDQDLAEIRENQMNVAPGPVYATRGIFSLVRGKRDN
jgi:hypothetical protein